MPIVVNCECQENGAPGAKTLSTLRTKLLRRLGFSAQASNPPPGVTELADSFLQDAQVYLYHNHTTFQTERFFTWTLSEGVRFYDLGDNIETCTYSTLDAHKITWVGVEQANGVWYELTHGIPPEHYTMAEDWQEWPSRYEVRECIEIFPAPSADMQSLRIKGHFGLRPFADDDDITTINPDALFLWALGLGKAHYGHPDAGDPTRLTGYFGMAINLGARLVAASHQTARYIPGTRPRRPQTPPRFLPLEE